MSTFKHHDLEAVAMELRRKILKYTGVPVCIGIGATKTLAKIANKIAKKQHRVTGVFYMNTPGKIAAALKATQVDDVWGIGSRYGCKLINEGVRSAYDFINLPEDYVLKLNSLCHYGLRKKMGDASGIPIPKVYHQNLRCHYCKRQIN